MTLTLTLILFLYCFLLLVCCSYTVWGGRSCMGSAFPMAMLGGACFLPTVWLLECGARWQIAKALETLFRLIWWWGGDGLLTVPVLLLLWSCTGALLGTSAWVILCRLWTLIGMYDLMYRDRTLSSLVFMCFLCSMLHGCSSVYVCCSHALCRCILGVLSDKYVNVDLISWLVYEIVTCVLSLARLLTCQLTLICPKSILLLIAP